jgi:hypothetical protein
MKTRSSNKYSQKLFPTQIQSNPNRPMKNHVKPYFLLGAALLGLTAGTLHAQIITVDCGAVSTNAGAKLKFVNGASYSAGSSGFVQPLTYQRISSRFGTNIVYCSTNLQFQAISVKTNPATAAALGSYVVCQVVSVSGPPGGVLSYWEQGAGWPTYEFPVNDIYATEKSRFILSNCEGGAGRPDGDPYGNIRGRRFVVNKPGDYLVTFKLYDTSVNNPTAKAAIHTPSDPLTIKFSTKIDMGITQLGTTNGLTTLIFKQGFLTNMMVEASTNMVGGTWVPVAGPYTNTPTLTTNRFTNDPALPAIFYRLHGITP